MDHLITRQWQRLAEIQQIQLEMMQDARPRVTVKRRVKKKAASKKRGSAPPVHAEAQADAPPIRASSDSLAANEA
jgi:hypothetical protein